MVLPKLENKKLKGFVTLVSIIILSSVGLLVVISSISINIENTISISSLEKGKKARYLAEACAEIALDELKNSIAYTGNQTINLTFGDCQIGLISGIGNNNRNFEVSANYANHAFRIQIAIDTINPNIIINSWNEI